MNNKEGSARGNAENEIEKGARDCIFFGFFFFIFFFASLDLHLSMSSFVVVVVIVVASIADR